MSDHKNISSIFADLAISLKNGNPLLESLEISILESSDKNSKKKLMLVKSNVLAGHNISECFQKLKGVSQYEVNLIKEVENGRHLSDILFALSQFRETLSGFYRNILLSLLYPLFVLIVAIIAIFVLQEVSIPLIEANKEDGSESKVLLVISIIFPYVCYSLLLIATSMIFLIKFNTTFRLLFYESLLKIPVINSNYKLLLAARYLTFLSLLLQQNISIHHALKITAETITLPSITQHLKKLDLDLAQGQDLSKRLNATLTQAKFIPIPVIKGMIWSIYTNSLNTTLLQLSEDMRVRLEKKLKSTSELIAPIILVASGILVITVAYSLFIPLLTVTTGTL